MLRRLQKDIGLLDAIDLQLLQGVDHGLTWSSLLQSLRSARCDPDEAAMRVLRLIQQGYLDGRPGEDSAPPSRPAAVTPPAPQGPRFASTEVTRPVPSVSAAPTMAPPPRSAPAMSAPAMSAPRSLPSTPTSTPPAGRSSLPPNALAAREALMRELATRRSGASYPPVSSSLRPSSPGQAPSGPASGYYSMRPSPASGSSVPPGASPHPSTPAEGLGRGFGSSVPPGRYSMQTEGSSGSSVPPGSESQESMLPALIDEFARGSDLQRWCAARLHEALEQERAGETGQAVGALQVAMSQNSDPRIRAERDRLQAQSLKATSGVYRARAITEERANRHKEAAENWRKVLEACPDDVEAAIHAATCCMEIGEIKQAGQHARRAVELAPQSVLAHRLMLRFFRKTGMELNANREREILRKLAKY